MSTPENLNLKELSIVQKEALKKLGQIGAEMFGYTKITLKIGKENTQVTKELLKEQNILIIKEFTGDDTGMSVEFRVSDYSLMVRPTGGKPISI